MPHLQASCTPTLGTLPFRCELRLTGDDLARVLRVRYRLPAIYPQPLRTTNRAAGGFAIAFPVWGSCTVEATIELRDGGTQRLSVDVVPDAKAGQLLVGKDASALELLRYGRRLRAIGMDGLARRALLEARAQDDALPVDSVKRLPPKQRTLLLQQLALATYKDASRPPAQALDEAWKILEGLGGPIEASEDPETLGLGGAVAKRRWELDGLLDHAKAAYDLYRRAYDIACARDNADGVVYGGSNAAFLADAIARSLAGTDAEASARLRDHADEVRGEILRRLEVQAGLLVAAVGAEGAYAGDAGRAWWVLTSVAEAQACLGRHLTALPFLHAAMRLAGIEGWQRETTVRQLQRALALRGVDPAATTALFDALGVEAPAVAALQQGKLGLALSGGGFRASLFHIGVLARLAELDLLRHVEVLSCVSGGSILGAAYYLAVKELLERRRSDEITRADYVAIVAILERVFLTGVQRNLRVRVASHLWWNVRMMLGRTTRTQRIAELYERELLAKVRAAAARAFSRGGTAEYAESAAREIWLNEQLIHPLVADGKDERNDEAFIPAIGNWRRGAKVPVLVLNATSLNTGHCWQFTATWMGETPGTIDGEFDANERLRRFYYHEAPPGHERVRMGTAVGASACVPGLFAPIELLGVYDKRIVRLVDGGVHDNQGVQGLLDQGCRTVLISDASGQMTAQPEPSAFVLGVVMRSVDILQERVRVAQLTGMQVRRDGGSLHGLALLHIKKGLPVDKVDWIGARDPLAWGRPPRDGTAYAPDAQVTDYGIPQAVQCRLAAVRTDLDSFCDAEAFALMLSGYRQAERFAHRLGADEERVPWRFVAVEPEVVAAPHSPQGRRLALVLAVAEKRTLKIWAIWWRRWLAVRIALIAAAIAAAGGLGWWLWHAETARWIPSGPALVWMIAGLVGGTLGVGAAVKAIRWPETLRRMAVGAALALVGFVAAWLHLLIFDPLYLAYGRVRGQAKPADPLS